MRGVFSVKRSYAIISCIFVVLVIVGTLSACSSKLDLSDEALSLANKTITETDKYLDGNSTLKTANATLESFYNAFDKLDAYGDDSVVKGLIFSIQNELFFIERGEGSKEKVLEKRNNLAKRIGHATKK